MSAFSPIKNISKLYIGGKWISSVGNKQKSLINPVTGKEHAQVCESTKEDSVAAIEAARQAFDNGPWYKEWSGANRRDALLKISSLISENLETFATIEAVNTGKCYADAEWEIQDCASIFKYYAGFADRIQGRYISSGTNTKFDMKTITEPLGVCGMISSFNYPLQLITWKSAPALAAGNTIVVKPAPQTPLSVLYLVQLINENKVLPNGVFNVITGGIEAGEAIVSSPNVDKISFTGSVFGGKAVSRGASASSNIKAVTLELGGKSPVIVMNDADLENASENILMGIFSNSGMNCCAGSKLYIQSGVYNKLVQILKHKTQAIIDGITTDIKTSTMCTLVDSTQLKKVEFYVNHAIENNEGKLLVGGKRWAGSEGYYFEPTIFVGVGADAKIAKEEIFGPVLSIMEPFEDLDSVIQTESQSEFGLAAAIFSSSSKHINNFTRNVKAGTTWINTYNYVFPDLPFGGFKMSGIGRELGSEVMGEYTATRSVISDTNY
ncbi:hypothetical protein BB559_005922 [Furculomyces boomerangus]|uniref:Aldehyde dehydrogenase domain-containing protein n=1 Tax=Furculomyces boomerangus TaxID=61424 RepID=A0A2T9Y5T0_9FUNG|nr:hypothetical protein BB559_005922 [Furculomyces boomerangus]